MVMRGTQVKITDIITGNILFLAPPKNRHFVPRYSKLRKAGGKSISFYEKWRKMQYDMNCVMKRYMELISVNLSGTRDPRTFIRSIPGSANPQVVYRVNCTDLSP